MLLVLLSDYISSPLLGPTTAETWASHNLPSPVPSITTPSLAIDLALSSFSIDNFHFRCYCGLCVLHNTITVHLSTKFIPIKLFPSLLSTLKCAKESYLENLLLYFAIVLPTATQCRGYM